MATVILKPGREESIRRRHPWVFAGAVKTIKGHAHHGGTVEVVSSRGERLARGAYSDRSQIRVRIWSFNPDEEITETFFQRRLETALRGRLDLVDNTSVSAYRLVNAESDGLPGLIVDRYGDFLVCQFLAAGVEYWKDTIVSQLVRLSSAAGVYERSDSDVRYMEGMKPRSGLLCGEEPPQLIEVREGPIKFLVDVRRGHKTGFYLDQRDNRAALSPFADKAEVLNCFSFSGGFGLMALDGGAERVTNIDTSADALDLALKNVELNGFDAGRVESIDGDVFRVLRKFRDYGRQFDLVVMDPPKFVKSIRQVETGSRGYKDINLLGLKLLRPGGVLFTFSCSGHMQSDLFQKIVAGAALDARREVQIIRYLGQPSDHPIALSFPEGRYLKGLICRVW